jgi:hypothetical protein
MLRPITDHPEWGFKVNTKAFIEAIRETQAELNQQPVWLISDEAAEWLDGIKRQFTKQSRIRRQNKRKRKRG